MRYNLLHSVFGFTSHCPHTPTCGTQLTKTIKNKNYGALPKILWKVLRCW